MPRHAQTAPLTQSASDTCLHIAPHMRACEVEGQVILLDLLRGRYLGLGPSQARALACRVADWPVGQVPANTDVSAGPDVCSLAARLLDQRILSTKPGATPKPPSIELPTQSLSAQPSAHGASITPIRVLRFLRAASSASLLLRLRSLNAIAALVSNRRQRSPRRRIAEADDLNGAVAAYVALRPLAFTIRDKCLFDSLALLQFLAAEGNHPHWLIGVKTRPFAAHSWVQSGPLVLNDDHEHVRSYRPILCA